MVSNSSTITLVQLKNKVSFHFVDGDDSCINRFLSFTFSTIVLTRRRTVGIIPGRRLNNR